jgi:cobalt-zinc-cadmium efflux system outer membrane protein
MRAVVLCAALAAVVLPSRAVAQQLSLTESEALARLSPDSPRVRAIQASVDVVRAEVLMAERWPNPRIIFDRESVAGITEDMTMVSQLLPVTGRRGLEVQAATTRVEASRHRADEALRRARADLRLAFARLVAAETRERELADARDRLQRLVSALAAREAAGDAAGFDRLRAEREVLDVEADLAGAATDRARLQAALVAFFADPVDPSEVVAVAPDKAPAPVPLLEVLLEHAETMRGELLALQNEIDAAQFAVRAADRRSIPEPEILAGAKSSNANGGDVGGVITVQAVVPLFDHGQPERALAEAEEARAARALEARRLEVRAEIGALRTAVLERRETAARYRGGAVAGAGEIERIAQVGYDAGERSILELLDAFRVASTARLRQATFDLAVREAEIELEFASGWELPS